MKRFLIIAVLLISAGEIFGQWLTGNNCSKPISDGVDEVWSLIFNTTDNLGYGYKSKDGVVEHLMAH